MGKIKLTKDQEAFLDEASELLKPSAQEEGISYSKVRHILNSYETLGEVIDAFAKEMDQ